MVLITVGHTYMKHVYHHDKCGCPDLNIPDGELKDTLDNLSRLGSDMFTNPLATLSYPVGYLMFKQYGNSKIKEYNHAKIPGKIEIIRDTLDAERHKN